MEPIDSLAPHFRLAKECWPDAPTLSNHYRAIVESYEGSAHSLIATIKSFVECVCLTILGEFGRPMPSPDPSTTELLVEALKLLGLQNSRGASKVDKLLSAHNKLADALSEMRNVNDPVAHGKDGFLDTLTINECRAYLVTADTILVLLLSAYDGTEPDLQYTREPYERFTHLHERVDRAVTVESSIAGDEVRDVIVLTLRTDSLPEGLELRIEPSRLLYEIDRTAYVELLSSSEAKPQIPPPSGDVGQEGQAAVELPHVPESTPPTAQIVPAYEGVLSPLKEALAQYLESLGLSVAGESPAGENLRDSLLATAERHMGVDWTTREPLLAAMKVALRRTLVQLGIDRDLTERSAGHVVSWLKIQAVGLTESGSART